jgi:predicted transcriptional regulator
MGKPRLNLRLRADLLRKLDEATRRPGVTKSALIEQALEEYFEPEIRHSLEERLLARLDRFEIRQGEVERDVALLLETLGQFVLYWLTRTDPIPEGEREIAHALGQRRFDYFIDQVARKVRRGGGIGSQFGLTAEVSPVGRDVAPSGDKDFKPL